MPGLIRTVKAEDLQPTGPLTVQPYQYDQGASLAIVHPRRGVLALIPPTNEGDDPDMHTAQREPWDAAYAQIFAMSPHLFGELHNVLRCYDRDNVPAFQTGSGQTAGVTVRIPHATATRIRELLTKVAL